MNRKILRLTALILALMLPSASLAELPRAVSFTMHAELHPEAYPGAVRSQLKGLADTLAITDISGTADMGENGSSRIMLELLLDGDERTCTTLEIDRIPSHWLIKSSLLGDTEVLLNGFAVNEFAVKTYYHLELSLTWPGLMMFYPFTTESAFWWIKDQWRKTFFAQKGSRTISRDDVLDFAADAADRGNTDNAFYYWTDAVFLKLGLSDMTHEWVDEAEEWADGFLGEDGLTITVTDDGEAWTTGRLTLLERHGDDWQLSLPKMSDGTAITASRQGNTWTVLFKEGRHELARLELTAQGMPEQLPFTGEASLSLDITGENMAGEQHIRWVLTGTPETYRAVQTDPETGLALLTLSGTWAETASENPSFDTTMTERGFNVLSVNDESLNEFISMVKSPMIHGMLPILVKLPASGYQSAIDLITDHGILSMLLRGVSAMGASSDDDGEEGDDDGEASGGEAFEAYADTTVYTAPSTEEEIDEEEWDDD